jgi:hypothetical protein
MNNPTLDEINQTLDDIMSNNILQKAQANIYSAFKSRDHAAKMLKQAEKNKDEFQKAAWGDSLQTWETLISSSLQVYVNAFNRMDVEFNNG